MTKWYCCSKCKVVDSYAIDENSGDTTFPRGEFLAHSDYITTGMETRKEAEDWLKEELKEKKD